jgi:hypothetical protein
VQCVLHAGEDLVPDSFEVFTFHSEISAVGGVEGEKSGVTKVGAHCLARHGKPARRFFQHWFLHPACEHVNRLF